MKKTIYLTTLMRLLINSLGRNKSSMIRENGGMDCVTSTTTTTVIIFLRTKVESTSEKG